MPIVSIESLTTEDLIIWVMVMDNGALEAHGVAFTHQAVASCVPEEVVEVVWGRNAVRIVALLELDVAELTAMLFVEFGPNFDLTPNDLQRDGPVKDVFAEVVRSVGADPRLVQV